MGQRIDYTSLSVGGGGQAVIVGGNSALSDDDTSTYLHWPYSVPNAGDEWARLQLPAFDYPESGWLMVHFKIRNNGPDELNPDPFGGYNGGYAIGLCAINWSFRDGNGIAAGSGIVEGHSDHRLGDGIIQASMMVRNVDASGPFSNISGFDTSSAPYVLLTFKVGGTTYFEYTVFEAWVELVDGDADDAGTPSPGKLVMATSGYLGESVFYNGRDKHNLNYAQVGSGISHAGENAFQGQMLTHWQDGRVTYPYAPYIYWSTKDRTGFAKVDHETLLEAYNFSYDGISLIPDRANKTAQVVYDYGQDPNDVIFYRLELGPAGVRSGPTEWFRISWSQYNTGMGRWDMLPGTGDCYGREMTFLGNSGQGNTSGSVPQWFSENLWQINLDTGDVVHLGSYDDSAGSLPFSWIFKSTMPTESLGLPSGTNTYVTAMAIDPTDGSYWFKAAGGIYQEPNITDIWWGSVGGAWNDGIYLLHTDREGNLLEAYTGFDAGGGGYISSGGGEGGMLVDGNGQPFFWACLYGDALEDTHISTTDEYDGVWFWDVTQDYTRSTYSSTLRCVVSQPWDTLYFSTGIWAVETNLHWCLPVGIPPLRHKQRNDGIGVSEGHARLNSRGSANHASSLQKGRRILKNTFQGYR